MGQDSVGRGVEQDSIERGVGQDRCMLPQGPVGVPHSPAGGVVG